MKKLLPLLIAAILILCSACSDTPAPSSFNTGTANSNSDILVTSREEAKALLQSWLNDNPFNESVTIRDASPDENDTGFMFILYEDEEIVQVRIPKANGRLLVPASGSEGWISIDDWYSNHPDKKTAMIVEAPNPTESSGNTPNTESPSSTSLSEVEARELLQTWIDEHPLIDPIIINDELTRESETSFNFVLYQKGEELVRVKVIKETSMLTLNIANQTVLLDGWYKARTDKPMTLSDNNGTEDDKVLYSQISYEDLARFPDENYGAGVILYGQVYHVRSNPLGQAINPDRNIIVLATREDNGLWCYDLVDVRFDFTPQGGRLIEGDWITVYGTASGLTSASNAPLVDAVEIIRD